MSFVRFYVLPGTKIRLFKNKTKILHSRNQESLYLDITALENLTQKVNYAQWSYRPWLTY